MAITRLFLPLVYSTTVRILVASVSASEIRSLQSLQSRRLRSSGPAVVVPDLLLTQFDPFPGNFNVLLTHYCEFSSFLRKKTSASPRLFTLLCHSRTGLALSQDSGGSEPWKLCLLAFSSFRPVCRSALALAGSGCRFLPWEITGKEGGEPLARPVRPRKVHICSH